MVIFYKANVWAGKDKVLGTLNKLIDVPKRANSVTIYQAIKENVELNMRTGRSLENRDNTDDYVWALDDVRVITHD